MLGTGGYAQAARVAFVGANRECLPIAVDPRFHSRDYRDRSLVLVSQLAHLENVVRTSLDAIFFGLASGAIDHWREYTCRLLAFGFR
jgi:hypothetical protein